MHYSKVLKTKGPSAIGPLKSPKPDEPNRVIFYAAFDGSPVLTPGGFCDESSFPTEAAALKFAAEWAKHQGLL